MFTTFFKNRAGIAGILSGFTKAMEQLDAYMDAQDAAIVKTEGKISQSRDLIKTESDKIGSLHGEVFKHRNEIERAHRVRQNIAALIEETNG